MATSKIKNTPSIIEQGTSGIWEYRKWSDGTAECWGNYTLNFTSMLAWGSLFYSQPYATVYFPTGLFVSPPVVGMTHHGSVEGWFTSSYVNENAVVNLYLVRALTATNGPAVVSIMAKGKWK